MLNPQRLQSFIALVASGSFTGAATRLGVTQAAISQHIGRLEDELGPLLIRRPRQIELTPAGRALLDYAQSVENADKQLRLRLSDADASQGEVSLITPGSVGLLLYPLLLALQVAQPGLVIRHRFAPDPEVLDAVRDGRFEVGLATIKPGESRLAASAFIDEPLELVVPAGREAAGWSDLERLGFIDHPDGQAMATRLLGLRFPRNPGLRTIPVRGFTNQVGLILEPVARGLGFTVIPRYARQAFKRPGAIRVIEFRQPVVDTLWLIHRAEWPLSLRARRAVDHLRAGIAAGRTG